MKKCYECNGYLRPITKKINGIKYQAMTCGKCKRSYVGIEQIDEIGEQLQAKRLKEEYIKKPIKIGHSLGMTFPKAIVEVFELEKAKIKIYPDVKNKKIELLIS